MVMSDMLICMIAPFTQESVLLVCLGVCMAECVKWKKRNETWGTNSMLSVGLLHSQVFWINYKGLMNTIGLSPVRSDL